MFESFKKFISHHSLFTTENKLLLAVSGGVDSMVMADLFLKSGYNFAVAHCNFKLRGKDSDADETFVKQWCEVNNIACYTTSFQTKIYAEENHLSIQMAARDLRYEYFNHLCQKFEFDFIVTAHQADDFAETIILKLLRNYGNAALQGVLPADGNRVRPMLFATKNDILEYAKQHQIKWRDDVSNFTDAYQRNKIRLHVLPVLKEINPSFSTNLVQQADFIYGDEKIINHYIETVSKQILSLKDKSAIISITSLKNTLSPLTVLYHLISPYGFRMVQTEALFNTLGHSETKKFYSEKYSLTKSRNEIIIHPKADNEPVYFEISECGIYEYNGRTITVSFEELKTDALKEISENADSLQAWFDSSEVSFPIVIRNKKDGDRFQPMGMKSNKKLSDFFIDLKYSSAEKEHQWVMESNEKIFWIVGKRISEPARVHSASKKILKIQVDEK